MINWQDTSILAINTPNPTKRNKSNIISKHYNNIKEENQKLKGTKSQHIIQSMSWKEKTKDKAWQIL